MTITVSRPDGSRQFLRFTGTIPTAGGAGAGGFGEFANPFVAGAQDVRFLMGLASTYVQPAGNTGVTDPRYRLPNNVYDDTQNGPSGTGSAPHAAVPSRTWAQNSVVVARALDANITNIVLAATEWSIDATSGLPILTLTITAVATAANVDIQVEIKHSIGR